MGKIKKTALERHTVTMSPGVGEFVSQAAAVLLHHLPAKLQAFPQEWPLPRGDLYHWIPLLNRFDRILELFNKEYGLDLGPQTQPFQRRLLAAGDAEEGNDYLHPQEKELDSCGFSSDGDRELIECILNFTKILMEHCGNRSLYSSSNHVSNLLHTTSLSLLRGALRLGLRLAQRYQVARYKNHQHHTHVALQKSHYDFNVENLQRMAQAFPRSLQTSTSQTPASARGKDKTASAATVNPSDLVTISKDPKAVAQSDMAVITCSYYDQSVKPFPTQESQPVSVDISPATPTPTRRTSNLGPSRDRPSPGARTTSDLTASTPVKSREVEASSSNAPKTYHISSARVSETPSWELVQESVQLLPKDHHFDILNRIRVAKAFSTVKDSGADQCQLLIETRLLAVANLAYALADSKFLEKVGQPDSDEPRRFHLATQLCEMLQPSTGVQSPIALSLEITILQTIEALAKTKAKVTEVAEALAINVNHGILYYELKKAIASLGVESIPGELKDLQELEWQDCTFDLIDGLTRSSPHARFAEKMVSAGIIGILVDVLQLRTQRAERFYEKVLAFFDAFIHGLREAFQIIANAKGLDAIADLTEYEVGLALRNLEAGNGMPDQFKSKVVDYEIPYWQQATLRQLFKVIVNMFENGSGMHDFLLRNLIDTPQILSSLRTVVGKAHVFGSNVFNGAISIICTFIHNEPTSYQVIAEAGLSKGVLEAIIQREIPDEPNADPTVPANTVATELTVQNGKIQFADCKGVLPVGETMADIPSTFGAICLNESGMKLFQSSGALNEFLNIFTSPEHVKALEEDQNTAFNVGSQFDELSRHHPQLKEQILNGVILMVKRVVSICKLYADLHTAGAKLWELQDGRVVMAGNQDITPSTIDEEHGEKAFVVPFISACAKFLDGFFQNSGMTNLFCEQGGAELILALSTAKASPHDFLSFPAFQRLNGVIKTMSDAKPHLVLPSIISRLQEALSDLKPFLDSPKLEAVLYVDPNKPSPPELSGTLLVRSLKDVQILVTLLGRVFHPSAQFGGHRHSSSNLFHTLNFTDVYIELVDSLGLLHSTCIWEHESLKQSLTHDVAQKSFSTMMPNRRVASDGSVITDVHRPSTSDENVLPTEQGHNDATSPNVGEKFLTSNAKAVRYLLHGTFTSIELSLHSLGVSLAPRRITDLVPKQNASMVAEHLADSLLSELSYSRSTEDLPRSVLLCCQALILDGRTKSMLRFSAGMDHTGREALTLVLNKFYLKGGITKLNELVKEYHEILIKEANAESQSPDHEKITENARWGLSLILSFYKQIVHSKCINEASQSAHIAVRDPRQADFFMPGQFVVELRNEILPSVSALWDASDPEHLGAEIKNIVDILKIILKGDGEERALKRGDEFSRRVPATKPEFKLRHTENLPKLTSAGYAEDLAKEALYRCNGHENNATEYCSLRSRQPDTPRFPVPHSDESSPQDQDQAAEDSNARQESVEMEDAVEQPSEGTAPEVSSPDHEMGSDGEDGNFGSLGALPADIVDGDLQAMLPGGMVRSLLTNMTRGPAEQSARPPAMDTEQPFVTFEDLEEKREALRQSLPDRCLSILAYHPNITFELAELIQAVVAKDTDNNEPRSEIANTLVMSLMSLQGEEPEDESDEAKRRLGLKISSYAHLVALVLLDRDFFTSTLDELQECMDSLVDWIRTGSEAQKLDDSPWIDYLLLIVERVLAEDEQPVEVQWTPPPADDPLKVLAEPDIPEPVVSDEVRVTLFNALVAMLPKIGKNPTLALSISRVLVILTRRRELADRLREKPSMTGLFTMVKQLSGLFNERLHGAIMLILRHLTEDVTILRQIMRTEIRTAFDNQRRNLDTTTYVRNLYPLVLRDPKMFVEITQEMCELARFDGNPHRGQPLSLKKEVAAESTAGASEAKDLSEGGTEEPNKGTETKPLPAETSGSVVHFLLGELSKYREVEDTPPIATKPRRLTSGGDVEMADGAFPSNNDVTGQPTQNERDDEAPDTKPVFKAEDHQIFVYRCFLLQALAELLGCYNRTKIEFIGFSRKVEPQPATPSKPRAGTLNYLINQLLPVGTLEHRDDTEYRKRAATSNWAISVLVSLCARTPEKYVSRYTSVANPGQEDDAELTLVRRFVLEHSLRSFKEALGSNEPLDFRYSRLLSLGDLFNRMMNGHSDGSNGSDKFRASQQQLGKLMYEKNFIGTLTSAIAELDLNFPNAKRAVKYILRPLKWLTDLAVGLSQTSDLSSSSAGNTTTEEDDMSSATSVSEEEEREQTPDLFRNSALSMFEANNGDEDDSESDDEEGEVDEEMYDDEDEEMEYDEEIVPEHGDVVSDEEDEDADDMGEVEGLPGDGDMDIEIVMDEDGEDGEDSEDEDEDADVDEDELDHEADYDGEFDEINGDHENDSLDDGGHDEGEWEDDDGFDEGAGDGGSPHGGPLDHIAQVIGADDEHSEHGDHDHVIRVDMGGGPEDFFEDELAGEPDPEDEEYDGDVVYEPEAEDEDDEEDQGMWGALSEQQHGGLGMPNPFTVPGRHGPGFHAVFDGLEDTFRTSLRTHRQGSAPRAEDEGTNPLLQRNGQLGESDRDPHQLGRPGRYMPFPRAGMFREFLNVIGPRRGQLNFDPRALGALNGSFILGDRPAVIEFGRPMDDMLHRAALYDSRDPSRSNRTSGAAGDEQRAVNFQIGLTTTRWQEEARMFFSGKHHEKAVRVVNSIARLLVPPAMEMKRKRDIEEAERRVAEEKAREEEKKVAEAQRAEREAIEKKEREEREAREAEERAAREAEELARQAEESHDAGPNMEGVESSEAQSTANTSVGAQGGASEQAAEVPAERVTINIRGRDLDITNLGIDREYLEALPEDMREEVIMSQFAEQRAQQVQSGEQPTEISRDFLDALPPDIRQEILRQEEADRRRRERDEARRQAQQAGSAATQPEEMNNADFMAMLDPGLRQAILMDADDTVLSTLPEHLRHEAEMLGGPVRRAPRFLDGMGRGREGRIPAPQDRVPHDGGDINRQRRPVVQMLDKAGIATLLRLMFVSLPSGGKTALHGILSDICKNTQNRAEVISILLSILQDGTADVSAVERSFAQLSLRAKQLSGPKTPQPVKRTVTNQMLTTPGLDLSPLNIVHQCLYTLTSLAKDNSRIPSFFLSEHETSVKSSKKGKSKEPWARFPINALLTLLDRKLIIENTGVMETLATLLSRVTHPLNILLRRNKENQEEEKKASQTGDDQPNEQSEQPQPGDVTMSEVPGAGPSTEAAEASNNAPDDENSKAESARSKHRDLVPPDVPEENLRLVVNILAARDCPSKTFSDTLDIIKNMSMIPGAKQVFAKELNRQAQDLGQSISEDLVVLTKHISHTDSNADLQGMALASFSSSSAKQRKLLRVLIALDHIFDPKRTPSASNSGSDTDIEPKLKEDVLATLHESPTFEGLWKNLSACLTAVREKGNLITIATILLPIIEALMVVCRNCKPKESSQDAPLSPTPETRMEGLFFKFTDDHRKILNELIRNNPKLMNGNLAVLAKNSKVLEFDNKRNYFSRKLHHRSAEERVPHPSLQLNIRRDSVFLDSFKSLYFKSGNEIKYGKLNIRFHGEEGIDAGGVTREWFGAMARQMFNPDYALFNPVASDRTTFHPNPLSDINEQHLMFYKFIGRIIGKALYEGRLLDCHFSRAVYKRILSRPVALKDMETLDLDFYKSLDWMLNNDITGITFETFSTEVDRFGETKVIDLKPDGRNIEVTEENKQEYVRLIVQNRLYDSVQEQLDNFLTGFYEIIPKELVAIFNEQELELLISGLPDIDIDDWKNNTEYHNYQATSPQIQWFWRAVRSFDKEEKAKLLQFVTGTSKVPLNGFKELEGMNGPTKFNIHRDYSKGEKLPTSHTCFNQLDLPEYETYEQLRQQLYTAITAGSDYFGFA
ncbi:hypothetical protein K431DRAFT_284040 [Polychaeton citri CBS 116435]|uniref:HECT-type E3 ubiquitin transferase n=1 Tax=Polychaeton citri CBS 116435 TaxID=1314669 RepID=A0A9P4QCD4_9PEZI|nr:hypothetical protein K431DRAFT_284040 [Polychaeton citri CBS 116435]